MSLPDELDRLARDLDRSGHPTRASTARQAATALRNQQQTIAAQRQEMIDMARNFVDATAVVVAHDKQLIIDNATLAANAVELGHQLAEARANQLTPEVQAAQQQIIDRAEQIQPSA